MIKKLIIKSILILVGTMLPAGIMLYLLETYATVFSNNVWYVLTVLCILYYSWFISVGINKITN